MLEATFEIVSGTAQWGDILGNIEDQSDLIELVNDTKGDIEQDISDLADTVTANYNDLSGQISDLSDTVTSNYNELSGNISDLSDTVSANYTDLDDKITVVKGDLSDHIANKSNPHEVTATQVGLGNCDNTSDLAKPISTATQTALDGKVDKLTDKPTAGTYTKVTVTNEGLVSAGDTLTASDIPSLTLAKISDVTATAEEVNILDGATVSTAELNYVDGVTSNIQTQINGKQATITGAATTVTSDDLTTAKVLVSDNNGKIAVSTISTTELDYLDNVTSDIQTQFNNITDVIPSAATSSNQLADKDFVNSTVSTNTAFFRGTYSDVPSLIAYSGTVTNNDYAFVTNGVITDNGNDWATFNDLDAYDKTLLTNFDYGWVINGANFDLYRFDIIEQTWSLRVANTQKASVTLNTAYNRYKATVINNVVTWEFEYTQNNSSYTAAQWAAINSEITSATKVTHTANTSIGNSTTPVYIASDGAATALSYTIAKSVPSNAVFTDTTYSIATGSTNGTISVSVNGGTASDVSVYGLGSAAYTASSAYATSSQGAKADTALQPNDNITELVNNAGYITGITSTDVTTALGYTPYDSSNPNGYTSNTGTVTSVNNISPINGNVSLSIPTVNNATLTIQKNSTTVKTFTANASSDVTCNISVPTDTGDLTNNAGFITNSAITNMQTTTNLVTSVSSASTDTQYPSAKLFYDTCGDIETLINAL